MFKSLSQRFDEVSKRHVVSCIVCVLHIMTQPMSCQCLDSGCYMLQINIGIEMLL